MAPEDVSVVPVLATSTRSAASTWRQVTGPPSRWVLSDKHAGPGGVRAAALRPVGTLAQRQKLVLRGAFGNLAALPLADGEKLRVRIEIADAAGSGSCFETVVPCTRRSATKEIVIPDVRQSIHFHQLPPKRGPAP